MLILSPNIGHDEDRAEAFKDLAQRQAGSDAVLTPPLQLTKEQRRLHVRQTLREDHQFRLQNKPEGAQTKFDTLADELYSFFRGTAFLYYRDHAGTDAHLPEVFAVGDVHPENFEVMPNEDGAPFFGISDFDEAYVAPFSYDVKRGALGFYLIAREAGLDKGERKDVVRAFVDGYIGGLKTFAQDDREKWHEFRIDNSPDMIRELLEEAQEAREDFLDGKIDLEKGRFVSSEEIVPHSKYVEDFQDAIDDYVDSNDIEETERTGHFAVKDVAIKKGSGTASLGLDRYWVLIDGPGEQGDHTDDIILELKHTRRSVLYGLTPAPDDSEDKAERTDKAQTVHLVGGDPYHGFVEMDGRSYLVRERSPFKDDIDVDDLGEDAMQEHADICGHVLAQAHARSDEDTGVMEGQAEIKILESIHPPLFREDVVRFAKAAAKRLKKDWKLFKKDHALGAFQFSGAEDEEDE